MVPARNVLFKFLIAFSHSRNFKSACCLEGAGVRESHLLTAQNFLKYAVFIRNTRMVCPSKICPVWYPWNYLD